MEEKFQIDAVAMVRRIRDEQSRLLSGKSPSEIIAFFREAGKSAPQTPNETRDLATRPHNGN